MKVISDNYAGAEHRGARQGGKGEYVVQYFAPWIYWV